MNLLKQGRRSALAILWLAGLQTFLAAEQIGRAARLDNSGKLIYEQDGLGNQIPDFSHAGYAGGGIQLPTVPAVVRVSPVPGDDGHRIQSAIEYVSELPPGKDGFRGAVVLEAGQFEVAENLTIRQSGVVLRGAGKAENGTVIVATGKDRRTVLRILGEGGQRATGDPVNIVCSYVPVGSRSLGVVDASGFSTGDRVIVRRPATEAWIEAMGMDKAPARTPYKWKPGTVDLAWERIIEAVEEDRLVLDAPLTTAVEGEYGGGTVQLVDFPGRISNSGIEHLRLISEYDKAHPKDEDHAWMAIEIDHAENVWVDNVTGIHFVSSVVEVGKDCRAITISDCDSLQPISEDGGYRRHAFHSSGQLVLFMRCFSEMGRCDFTTGYQTSGPVVFLDCRSRLSSGMSGSIGSWSSGLLFDNVHIDGGRLALDNLEIRYGGVGWAAANSVLWQCSASEIVVRSPPGALNWGIGVWGEFYGNGRWQQSNEFVAPQSLYVAQLAERGGPEAVAALQPRLMREGADEEVPLIEEYPIGGDKPRSTDNGHDSLPMRLENGWLITSAGLMTGGQAPGSWWRGHLAPARTGEHNPSLTRFLPGRYGNGATDDFNQLAIRMQQRNEIQLRHHYGLWYDRRREDHQMIRRMSDDVWPPFFEQPYARSGEGTAWDGLSRYDLKRFNPWYFKRLHDFSIVCRKEGLLLVNEMFFQHNIIESGAHWVDCPWRPLNNINGTPFPEPPPFTGDTVKIGNMFYNIGEESLREIHRDYIRQCLSNLAGQPNVIHTTGDEFTGPLGFAEFWLDTIDEWIAEGNPDPLIALSVTKDVQDALLMDPGRRDLVDVVEIKYWFMTDDGLFAPEGGVELAPRQHLRKWKGARPNPGNVASMIREYRLAFPDKAVICSEIPGMDGWAVLAGGGSLPNLPATLDPELRRLLPLTSVLEPPIPVYSTQWMLAEPGSFYLVYSMDPERSLVDLREFPGDFLIRTIDLKSGTFNRGSTAIRGGKMIELENSGKSPMAYWISRITD